MKYLLDTNILSELKKPKPEKKVIKFIDSINVNNCYISSITIGEIQKGISSCKDSLKQKNLEQWLEHFILEECKDQILNLDAKVMRIWGKLVVNANKNLSVMDSLIAAIAISNDLILVTRNVKDFDRVKGLRIVNPWD